MGRKPNKLILEFFERGQKLDDSSNRYQHTCKSCGEKFPKGRIDSLTTHLLRKCPAVTLHDRQRAIHFLSETPNQHGTLNPMAVAIRNEQVVQNPQVDLAFAASYPMSALETLAEVSRRQLDHNGAYIPVQGHARKRRRSSAVEANNRLMSPSMFFHEFPVENQGELASRSFDVNNQLLAGINAFTAAHQQESSETSRNDHLEIKVPTASMVPAQQLALAASAATEMLPEGESQPSLDANLPSSGLPDNFFQLTSRSEQPQSTTGGNAIDPQLEEDELHDEQKPQDPLHTQSGQVEQFRDDAYRPVQGQLPSASGEMEQSSVYQDNQAGNSVDERGYSQFDTALAPASDFMKAMNKPALPHSQFMSDFQISGNSTSKLKSRGRFSASRRKEVQEVRKQGACVRCRMLKKPCSGGTPCTTCSSVESARLWKHPCVRTRIADEFDLYSAGLYTVLAFHETSNFKHQSQALQPSSHQVEVTHFPDSTLQPASISTVKGLIPDEITINDDPASAGSAKSLGLPFELLDQDKDDVNAILDQYMKRMGPILFEAESSTFMRPTLLLAADFNNQKHDQLLDRALSLWTATQILVDPAVQWHLYSTQDTIFLLDEQSVRQEILPTSNTLTHHLITHQLLALSEKRAAFHAKTMMNDLERRLLHRQQAALQSFETFLAAVILINCVERMCWHFNHWVDDPINNTTIEGPSRAGWPLENSPGGYVVKGERIADVVDMLLRMRGVPPQTIVGSQDGILREYVSPQSSSGSLASIQNNSGAGNNTTVLLDPNIDDSTNEHPLPRSRQFSVSAWLESVHVSASTLLAAQTTTTWDENDCRSWDLRWVSHLLLHSEK